MPTGPRLSAMSPSTSTLIPMHCLTIPSIHDGTTLDCRLYHPPDLLSLVDVIRSTASSDERRNQAKLKCAVIAHPYAPLGGSYDDPIVLSVADTLVERGFVVCTFNFRGATGSEGQTSWTGSAEVRDFESVVGFLIHHIWSLDFVRGWLQSREGSPTQHEVLHGTVGHRRQRRPGIELLLAGYSYGALVLARLPPLEEILERWERMELGSAMLSIVGYATGLAVDWVRRITVSGGPEGLVEAESEPFEAANRLQTSDRQALDTVETKQQRTPSGIAESTKHGPLSTPCEGEPFGEHERALTTRYLLISPVLLPFTRMLSSPGLPSMSLNLRKRQDQRSQMSTIMKHRSLAVFGSKDAFTSSSRLRGWAETQASVSLGRLEWQEVRDAGHFWNGANSMVSLKHRIAVWLQSTAEG